MAEQSAIIHRLTGLPIASMPISSDGRFLAGLLRQKHVRYLVLTPERYEYFKPDQRTRMNALLAAEPACCQLVKGSNGYEIYRVGW